MISSTHSSPWPFNSRPHKEVDARQSMYGITILIFQFTTSQGGRRDCGRTGINGECLSIHDLTRRSTIGKYNIMYLHISFQFTTSQGGRRIWQMIWQGGNPFQFTTSQGGRRCYHLYPPPHLTFQFTTSQGGRPGYVLRA